MRLFVAVELDDPIKDALSRTARSLAQISEQGSFTRRENFHLTLAFLGETSRLAAAKRAVQGVDASGFRLSLRGLGRFRRDGGDIWWVGVEPNRSLERLHRTLVAQLAAAGFALEDRPFRPHLTLGRQVVVHGDPEEFAPISMEVNRFSLMKSERVNGLLTYTELCAKELPRGV